MRRVVTGLVALAVLAGCGTTVGRSALQQQGLSAGGQTGSATASGGSGGSGGGSTGAPGSSASGASSAAGAGSAASGADSSVGSEVTSGGGAVIPGGVTSATGPIEIGIVRTQVSNAAAYGASLGNTVTEADVDSALVAAFNDHGGIDGRKIVPVYADTDTGAASWDASFQAACAKFTQDNHVVAVLGYVFNHDDAFETCLARLRIPHLSTTFNVPDKVVLAQYPLLFALSTPRIERRTREKVDGALATGIITKASKIGVIIDSCPGTQRAWSNVSYPYMQSKGLNVVAVEQFGCAHGAGDSGSAAAQAGNVILQFRSKGVDTVMLPAVSEGPALLIGAEAAQAQGWFPKWVVSSLANAAVIGNQMPAAQAADVYGYGWMPAQDVNPPQWPGFSSSQLRCISMLKDKGIVMKSAADYSFGFNICEAMFVYERALAVTHGHTDGGSVAAAIETFGTSFVSALNLNGRSTYAPTQHDAPSLARSFAWDKGCSCFTYRSTMVPIP